MRSVRADSDEPGRADSGRADSDEADPGISEHTPTVSY